MGSFLFLQGGISSINFGDPPPTLRVCVAAYGASRFLQRVAPPGGSGDSMRAGLERLSWSRRKRPEHPGTPWRGRLRPHGVRRLTRRRAGRTAQRRRRLFWTKSRMAPVQTGYGRYQWSGQSGGPSAAAAGDCGAGAGTETRDSLRRRLQRPLPGRRLLRLPPREALAVASPRLGRWVRWLTLGSLKYLSQFFCNKPFIQVHDYLLTSLH